MTIGIPTWRQALMSSLNVQSRAFVVSLTVVSRRSSILKFSWLSFFISWPPELNGQSLHVITSGSLFGSVIYGKNYLNLCFFAVVDIKNKGDRHLLTSIVPFRPKHALYSAVNPNVLGKLHFGLIVDFIFRCLYLWKF